MPTVSEKKAAPQMPRANISDAQNAAKAAAEKAKIALVGGHQERLVALSTALDKAEQRREESVERLSDRVAYLQDADLFMHDVLKRSQEKLRGEDRGNKQQTAETAIDALVDAFDVIDWELPAIAPHTVAGALPM